MLGLARARSLAVKIFCVLPSRHRPCDDFSWFGFPVGVLFY